MKIACFSDPHNQYPAEMPDADFLFISGDLTGRGSEMELEDYCVYLAEWVKKYQKVIVIAGNHDWIAERQPEKTRQMIEATGAVYLNDQAYELKDEKTGETWKVWGSPIQPWFFDWAFNRGRGVDIQEHWDLIPDDTEILMTHGPVFGYGDQVKMRGSPNKGEHVGCANLRQTIETRLTKVRLHISGHIHEGHGVYTDGRVTYINCSLLDERYSQVNKVVVFELHKEKADG